MQTEKQWIIVYIKGGRVGSMQMKYKELLQSIWHVDVIQTDANGNEHWEVTGIKHTSTNRVLNKIQKMDEE